MSRCGSLPVAGSERDGAMKNWRYIGMHAIAAARSFSCCSVTR